MEDLHPRGQMLPLSHPVLPSLGTPCPHRQANHRLPWPNRVQKGAPRLCRQTLRRRAGAALCCRDGLAAEAPVAVCRAALRKRLCVANGGADEREIARCARDGFQGQINVPWRRFGELQFRAKARTLCMQGGWPPADEGAPGRRKMRLCSTGRRNALACRKGTFAVAPGERAKAPQTS